MSPTRAGRLEVYGIIDGVWHTAVMRVADSESDVNVLVTFHRQYERKVLGRARLGRIRRREDIEAL